MYNRREQDWRTPKDPNDRPRLWPWVVLGLFCAWLILTYHEGVLVRLTHP